MLEIEINGGGGSSAGPKTALLEIDLEGEEDFYELFFRESVG